MADETNAVPATYLVLGFKPATGLAPEAWGAPGWTLLPDDYEHISSTSTDERVVRPRHNGEES